MALSNLFGWKKKEETEVSAACGTACGAADKPAEKPAACGTACGAADKPEAFAEGFDSGDHLHPSDKAYERMAMTVPDILLK